MTKKRKTEAKVLEGNADNQNVGAEKPGVASNDDVASGCQVLGKLTAEQYWEWRATVAEMRHSEVEYELAQERDCVLRHKTEIQQLRHTIHANSVVPAMRAKADVAKREYERFRKSLEKSLGFSIADCVIDETFAIKRIDQTK